MAHENYNKRAELKNRVLLLSISLSIIIHLFAVIIKVDFASQVGNTYKSDKQSISIKLKRDSLQRVESEETGLNKPSENAKYLSKSNQTFDRQTVAKINGMFKKSSKGSENSNNLSNSDKKNKQKVTLSDLSINAISQDYNKKVQDIVQMRKKGMKSGESLKTGLAKSGDFIDDIPLGDATNLNTVEDRYYGFYNRIRIQVEQYWRSSVSQVARKMMKKGRRMPASSSFKTSIVVILNSSGDIMKLSVENSSGSYEFDQVAVDSFSRAKSFPNPPKGMLKNGMATIRWGLVVES